MKFKEFIFIVKDKLGLYDLDLRFSLEECKEKIGSIYHNYNNFLNNNHHKNYDMTRLIAFRFSDYLLTKSANEHHANILPLISNIDSNYLQYGVELYCEMRDKKIGLLYGNSFQNFINFETPNYKLSLHKASGRRKSLLFRQINNNVSKIEAIKDVEKFYEELDATNSFYIELAKVLSEDQTAISEFVKTYKDDKELLYILVLCTPIRLKILLVEEFEKQEIDISKENLVRFLDTFINYADPESDYVGMNLKPVLASLKELKNNLHLGINDFNIFNSILMEKKLKDNLEEKQIVNTKKLKI